MILLALKLPKRNHIFRRLQNLERRTQSWSIFQYFLYRDRNIFVILFYNEHFLFSQEKGTAMDLKLYRDLLLHRDLFPH